MADIIGSEIRRDPAVVERKQTLREQKRCHEPQELGPLFLEPEISERIVVALRFVNVIAFVCVVVVNGLGASGVIAGRSRGDVSDDNPTPITPSGYAFLIWGLIYAFQAALF